MEITKKLKERFCKDCNIPINIFEEPYFMERLKLYDTQYETMEKWDLFVNELKKYDCEQDYFEHYNEVKDNAINSIKNSFAYEKFNEEDMNKFSVSYKNLPKKDIYKESSIGGLFCSIDMKKANFSAMRHYDPAIFEFAKTWEEFISKFTDNEHIKNSKYIRQVIMGNCNPKRQVTYEKYIMGKVLNILFKEIGYKEEDIVFFSNDEIVIDICKDGGCELHKIKTVLKENFDIPFHFEMFRLQKIYGTEGYLKEFFPFIDKKYEIKCLNGYMLPFVLRKLQKEEIEENDKVFMYEGMLSKFIDLPKIHF